MPASGMGGGENNVDAAALIIAVAKGFTLEEELKSRS
jgi:hypothetical protein